MTTVCDVLNYMDVLAPFSISEEIENIGLLIGDKEALVKKVAVALDATQEVIEVAIEIGCQLLITHHPLIYYPLKNIYKNSCVDRLIKSDISVISAHLNLDIADGGINDALCEVLNLSDVKPLQTDKNDPHIPYGLGRIGKLKNPLSPLAFANEVKKVVGTPCLNCVFGKSEIKTVAVCGGGGGDLLDLAKKRGADAFISAEIKHHQQILAKEIDITTIDAGHFYTEIIGVKSLFEKLKLNFIDIEFLLLGETPPACFI